MGLMLMSPLRAKMFKFFKPKILEINSMVDRFTKTVSASSLGDVLRIKETKAHQVMKEFYIYEYQRWWVGKQWMSSHWSDEGR